MLRGIGTSNGIGMGRAMIVDSIMPEVKEKQITDTAAEKDRYQKAKNKFICEIQQMIEDLKKRLGKDDKTALILQNQIYLVKDIEMENGINQLIEEKRICAEAAVEQTCEFYITLFGSSDNEIMKQRVTDIVDLKNRMTGILMGKEEIDLTRLPKDTVIVARELQPSVTALMDTRHVVGIVAEKGGETSHAAILARALEIPAVLSIKDALGQIKTGNFIIVDGEYGEIFINPIPKTIEIYKKKRNSYQKQVQELKKYINKETVTRDGRRVCLAANIGNAGEAAKAMEAGAECVGLFRTEFLFMNGTSMPTEEDQFEAYKKAAVICKDKVLTIRTLDIGGDKDIPYMGLAKEANPFLGYRAIRFCLGRIDIFTAQLRAILRASAYGNIRIMLPLVTGINELRAAKTVIHNIMNELDSKNIKYDKDIPVGVMIETPAACMIADILAQEAAFFSIGTNDLTQYILAVDRGNENVAYLYSSLHPSVLRAIKRIIECAKEKNIEVGMCGEAAASPAMIPLLLTFGLDEFSVTATKVLETRKNIASWIIREAAEVTDTVMSMHTEREISDYLQTVLEQKEALNGTGI